MSEPSDEQRLLRLIQGAHTGVFLPTHEEDEAVDLVIRAAVEAKRDVFAWSMDRGVRNAILDEEGVKNTEHPAAALHYLRNEKKASICLLLDIVEHLEDERTLREMRELIRICRQYGGNVILVDHSDKVPGVIKAHTTVFHLDLPEDREIENIVRQTLQRQDLRLGVKIDITRGKLRMIVKNLAGLNHRQIEQIITDTVTTDRTFSSDDLNHVLAMKRQALSGEGLLEYIETPADLSEIGGLTHLKKWLRQRRGAMTDKAAAFGLQSPRGIMLLGVPGAGKSLCAKAIATAWQRPLLRLDPSVLYDRFIGESERRLRQALQQAEAMAPIILWIDEIEKGFASAASRSVDGGLSKRMFGTLLTWMQDHRAPVFMVATANDIEALPPELMRKGRFDEIFFVDLPTKAVRRKIFEIHLKKRDRDPANFDLRMLADASAGYSGAEIEQAVIAGLYDAFADRAQLATEHIVVALQGSPPLSVTMAEKIAVLRDWAKTRSVAAE